MRQEDLAFLADQMVHFVLLVPLVPLDPAVLYLLLILDFQGVQHFLVGPVVYLQDQEPLAVLLLLLNQLDPGVQKRQQDQAVLMVPVPRSLLQDPLDPDLPCFLRYLPVPVTRRDRADPANQLPLDFHWVLLRRGVPGSYIACISRGTG